MALIGMTGPSGSYKTQVAKRLEKAHGFRRLHAGEPIKSAVAAGFGLSKLWTTGEGKDKPVPALGGASNRDLTEVMGAATHAVAPNATAAVMQRRVMKHLLKGRSVVVDGIRSPVEAAAIKKMGGQIWRADNGKKANPDLPMDQKQTEVKHDHVISTKGTKTELHAAVDAQMLKGFGLAP